MQVGNITKLIYVVIDGMGDLPIEELNNRTPLEAAETPHMDFLAKNGKTGLMYCVKEGFAPESDVAVISILGYDPFKYSTGRGVFEVIGADLPMKDGDLALRCNFATLGNGGRIIDRRVGRSLTSEEAGELSRAINDNVILESSPVSFDFKSTTGHRAALVMRSDGKKSLSSKITNMDPAYSRLGELGMAKTEVEMVIRKCQPMDETEEAKISARLVNEFFDKSHEILERHEINRNRSAKRKLEANIVLTRDAGHLLPKFFNINRKYGLKFVSLTDMPVERGISKLTGMEMVDLPPPSENLRRDSEIRVDKLLEVLPFYDCFYIHIKGPDEPGHDGNFELKARLISIIDDYFLGKLLDKVDLEKIIICVTSDHSTPCKIKTHSDDPVPVVISGNKIHSDGVEKFSEKTCRKGSLGVLEEGTKLMSELISYLKT